MNRAARAITKTRRSNCASVVRFEKRGDELIVTLPAGVGNKPYYLIREGRTPVPSAVKITDQGFSQVFIGAWPREIGTQS